MIRMSVSKKGQVTLPAEVRQYLNIKPKTDVYFVIENGSVRLIPAEKGIESLKGVIKTKGLQNFKDARNYTMGELANERISRIARD